jgi:hypothetical protein
MRSLASACHWWRQAEVTTFTRVATHERFTTKNVKYSMSEHNTISEINLVSLLMPERAKVSFIEARRSHKADLATLPAGRSRLTKPQRIYSQCNGFLALHHRRTTLRLMHVVRWLTFCRRSRLGTECSAELLCFLSLAYLVLPDQSPSYAVVCPVPLTWQCYWSSATTNFPFGCGGEAGLGAICLPCKLGDMEALRRPHLG